MQIHQLRLVNFRQHEDTTLAFGAGLTGVIGPNGSGKTTLLEALAWALYGFTAVHRLSGEAEFLDTARRCAECYLRRAPEHLVPPWDFDAPDDGKRLDDSSAATDANPDPAGRSHGEDRRS